MRRCGSRSLEPVLCDTSTATTGVAAATLTRFRTYTGSGAPGALTRTRSDSDGAGRPCVTRSTPLRRPSSCFEDRYWCRLAILSNPAQLRYSVQDLLPQLTQGSKV
eukprot:Amastigsp_a4473_16.p3 type:complete len:106 gc:universal Amastigsp_a4473_16:203-520(+)